MPKSAKHGLRFYCVEVVHFSVVVFHYYYEIVKSKHAKYQELAIHTKHLKNSLLKPPLVCSYF